MINIPAFNEYLEKDLKPLLAKYNATLEDVNTTNYFDNLVTIKINDEKVNVSAIMLQSTKSFEFFLKNFNDVANLAQEMLKIESPFYSDVHQNLINLLGTGKPLTSAYMYVCNVLRDNGKHLTGD